jgi:hypothetical protein
MRVWTVRTDATQNRALARLGDEASGLIWGRG